MPEELMRTVTERPQCSQNIHIGQLMTVNCHCINLTSMEDINEAESVR